MDNTQVDKKTVIKKRTVKKRQCSHLLYLYFPNRQYTTDIPVGIFVEMRSGLPPVTPAQTSGSSLSSLSTRRAGQRSPTDRGPINKTHNQTSSPSF